MCLNFLLALFDGGEQEHDRFCSYNSSLARKHLRSALLTVAWNADDWTFDALVAHYQTLVRYCNFEDMGMVLGYGCGSPSMTKATKYPEEAYKLGRSLWSIAALNNQRVNLNM